MIQQIFFDKTPDTANPSGICVQGVFKVVDAANGAVPDDGLATDNSPGYHMP